MGCRPWVRFPVSRYHYNCRYSCNGLNDRLPETVNSSTTTFTMDLNAGLTQALSNGTNTYIYGVGRIAQINTDTEYFLGDALGSVRQMTNAAGTITYARAYDPYGVVTSTSGSSQSAYAFTGESYGITISCSICGQGCMLPAWDGSLPEIRGAEIQVVHCRSIGGTILKLTRLIMLIPQDIFQKV